MLSSSLVMTVVLRSRRLLEGELIIVLRVVFDSHGLESSSTRFSTG